VRISKEITEFMSGKDEAYAWDTPTVTPALSPEQRAILEKRGDLDSAEIHRLASKTRHAMGGEPGQRAGCHSDRSDAETAGNLQTEQLDPETLEPLPDSPPI
jgi:hypothetical protein